MKLSVIIPACNEEGAIEATVRGLFDALSLARIPHEIVVVDDGSQDRTGEILRALAAKIPTLVPAANTGPHGFGMAVRRGFELYTGDVAAVYMADASDSPEDLIRFYRVMAWENVDCVFGTRFAKESRVVEYPRFKYVLNRTMNLAIRLLFGLRYNDVSNAFKLYRRPVIDGLQPFLSMHFNLTVELPLKAIIRGYTFAIVPNAWTNRKTGVSKLQLKEMGSRYLFIIMYCWIEKWLSRGDYRRGTQVRELKSRKAA